jgi:hypothetical protein
VSAQSLERGYDLVILETMPDWLRESHRAAGGDWGFWPHNGAEQRLITREEAEAIVAADEDHYDHIVRDATREDLRQEAQS